MPKRKERMKMEIHDIDVPEMEKQRYQSIKNSGEYAELKILVGVENDKSKDGVASKSPIVTTSMHNCGPEEIACLYVTLKTVLNTLKNRFPFACFMGETTMEVQNMGAIDLNKDEEE